MNIGGLYKYPEPRRLYEDDIITDYTETIDQEEPFVLLEMNDVLHSQTKTCRILTIRGTIGWIDVKSELLTEATS